MGEALIGFLSMAILAGFASLVHWGLRKWRPQTTWKTSLLVTVVILFALGPVFALIDGTLTIGN